MSGWWTRDDKPQDSRGKRLEATATEMLAALIKARAAAQELHGHLECPDCPETFEQGDPCPMLEQVDAAIARAEGSEVSR